MGNDRVSSMVDIAAVTTIVPALILLRHSFSFKTPLGLLHFMEASSKKEDNTINDYRDWRVYMIKLTADFLFIVIPVLLFVSVLAEWTQIFAICLVLLLLVCIAIKRCYSSSPYSEEGPLVVYSVRTTISAYRVSMMIITCLCILAVDFNIFPRRYAKAGTYGTGLMDLGVGSFVLANALVSRQARNIPSMNWKIVLQSTCPWIILGFGRLITTTALKYQTHVGEYGVHWNFFFTLAAVSILTSINIRPRYCGILGVLILIGYQIWLKFGLNVYLLSGERSRNIISENKEGIYSIFGFWGMYLVGVLLGYYLFHGNNYTPKGRNNQRTWTKIWILCALFWLSTFILDEYVEKVSRRMCNLAYVTFVFAQNLQGLGILMFSDIIRGHKTSVLEGAFDRNLLGIFLLANVLTGLTNICIDTRSASSTTALIIMVGYSFVLCISAGFLELLGIKVKFWK